MAKKKIKRYDDGGDVDGGLREVSKSRFDEDTNARAKSFTDSGYRAETMPVENEPAPKVRSLSSPSPAPKKAATSSQETIGAQGMREAPSASYGSDQVDRQAPAPKTKRTSTAMARAEDETIERINKAVAERNAKKSESKSSPSVYYKKGNARKTDMAEQPYKKGGKVGFSRGDGIAQRGKTKGRMV